MKRFIICILLVVGLIWAGDWTFDRLTEVKDHVLAEIDGISPAGGTGRDAGSLGTGQRPAAGLGGK